MGVRARHLGASASALVDEQLDDATARTAWRHVAGCPACRRRVDRELRLKARLAGMPVQGPPAHLVTALRTLPQHVATVPMPVAPNRGASRRHRVALGLAGAGTAAALMGIAVVAGLRTVDLGAGTTATPASLSPAAPQQPPPAVVTSTPGVGNPALWSSHLLWQQMQGDPRGPAWRASP